MAFLDIQKEVAAQARMKLSDANLAILIKRWINMSYKFVNSLNDWPWLFDRKVVQTEVDTSLTSVTVASGGTTVGAAAGSFVAGDVGKFIQFSTSNDWYKIVTYTSAIEVEIEIGYVGDDALTDDTATMRKVYYSFGDIDTILDVRQAVSPSKLEIIHHRKFDEDYPDVETTGSPQKLHIWGLDSDGYYQFSLFPIPDAKMNLEIRYKKTTADMVNDDDEPNIPSKWAELILPDGALWRAMLYSNKIDEATLFKSQFIEAYTALKLNAFPESDSHPIMESSEVVGDSVEMKWPNNYG